MTDSFSRPPLSPAQQFLQARILRQARAGTLNLTMRLMGYALCGRMSQAAFAPRPEQSDAAEAAAPSARRPGPPEVNAGLAIARKV